VFGHVCQSLIVVSNCSPGSPQKCAASAIFRIKSRAPVGFADASVEHVAGLPLTISSTASMNSSVTRTELFAFWKNTDPYASPSMDES